MNLTRSSPCSVRGNLVLVTLATLAALASLTHAATVTIAPIKDNTIYSESNSSNGGGDLYVGRTKSGGVRRALVQFDILGNVPAGALIESISVSFVQTQINGGATGAFELHRLNQAWGEGTAAGAGQGATAGAGDATWSSAANGSTLWATAGGDFAATSGSTTFSSALTAYTFASSAGLVADVQNWLDTPASNFGWLLRASDEASLTARELGSRGSVSNTPSLVINFTPVPEPSTVSLFGAMLLLGCGSRRRKR
jgi:hypothetical protein